jgi:hypothetical protein
VPAGGGLRDGRYVVTQAHVGVPLGCDRSGRRRQGRGSVGQSAKKPRSDADAAMKASHAKAGTPPALKAWVADLTFDGADIPVRGMAQRMIHPGLEPIAGNGFVAAQPVRRVDIPGAGLVLL